MSILGDRIKALRKARGLNQTELAAALNQQFNLKIDRVMISKWETDFQTPVMHSIICLAKYFNVSIDYLNGNNQYFYENESHYPSSTIVDNYVTFPVIGEIAAGYDSIALEDWEGDTVDIPLSYLQGCDSSEFFVLKVKGDSMFPTYQEGDKILILKSSTMEYSGQVGAVLYDNEYASLKKIEFNYGEDWMRLVAINPNVPIKTIENEDLNHCRIIGIARKLIRDIY